MARRYSGSIRIDVHDVIGEIGDEDLLEEVRDRKLIPAPNGVTEAYPIELVEEAHAALLVGRVAEAVAILDRLIHPKWRDSAHAQKQYDSLKLS